MADKRSDIIELLNSKVSFKQDLADYAVEMFEEFKQIAQNELDALRNNIEDQRIRLDFIDKSEHEFTLFVGNDALVFQLQRDIYKLPDENPMWDTAYLSGEESNGYFAIVNIYNFLVESIEKNRLNDIGYLVGRVFVNNDEHFITEGNGQLGFLFRDLADMEVNEGILREIIQSSISYALEFDMITPPYEMIRDVSVIEIQAISSELQQGHGKRMGFKFDADNPESK